MNTSHMWKRLLWKEYRENWPVLVIGVAMAAACAVRKEYVMYPMLFLSWVTITVWAAGRVQGRQGKVRTAVPISPTAHWVAMYLLPLGIPLVIGVVGGWALAIYFNTPAASISLTMSAAMVANFLVSTALTRILAIAPGILGGVALLMTLATVQLTENGGATASPRIYLTLIAGSLLASALYEAGQARFHALAGRVAGVAVLLCVVGWLTIPGLGELRPASSGSNIDTSVERYLLDGRYGVNLIPSEDVQQSGKFCFRLIGSRQQIWHTFERPTRPLVIVSRTQVLMLQQAEHDPMAHVLRWDTAENSITEVMRFNAPPDLQRCEVILSVTGPDQRYVLFTTAWSNGNMGISHLWGLDLQEKRAALIKVDFNAGLTPEHMSWTGDRAIISGMASPLAVDLRTFHVTEMRIPMPGRNR